MEKEKKGIRKKTRQVKEDKREKSRIKKSKNEMRTETEIDLQNNKRLKQRQNKKGIKIRQKEKNDSRKKIFFSTPPTIINFHKTKSQLLTYSR